MSRKVKQEAAEKPTTHIRVYTDLAEMIGWIVRIEKLERKGGSARVVDPLVRPAVRAKYNRYKPHIERLKAIEDELRAAENEVAGSVIEKPAKRAE